MNADKRFFVDTNVLLYSIDPAVPSKRQAARGWLDVLWETSRGSLSWQVLHEFYVNAVRKLGSSTASARTIVETFVLWRPVDTSLGLVQRAWQWGDDPRLSYWDGLILSAAERSGCHYLLSEDFQAGQKFGGVTIVSPFRESPEAYGLSLRRSN
jgi:predicted nucleic acid-binding protein